MMSPVAINHSTIHHFQKNGIAANEVGTDVSIDENVVTGIGPTPAAQNGIQIGFRAGGRIHGQHGDEQRVVAVQRGEHL
jgi:hypothetical protein